MHCGASIRGILGLTRSLSSHPWSHVVIGMWHKYPNPHCSHVVTIDVVDRSVDPTTGIIRTERVLGCKQKAPVWIVKVCRMRSSTLPFSYSVRGCLVLWRLRGCLRTRNILHQPSDTKCYDHFRQPLPFTIRYLLREHPILASTKRYDKFRTNG